MNCREVVVKHDLFKILLKPIKKIDIIGYNKMKDNNTDIRRIRLMDMLRLAQEIIEGKRLQREDDFSFFLDCDLKELCQGADKIREYFVGDKVDLCSIINGRSGKCPEDCKYCAQSAHHHTNCEVYDFLPEKEIVEACKFNESQGVDRFSIVTSGKTLTGGSI